MDVKPLIAPFLTSVVGGIITGVISQGVPWWREKLGNRKSAEFTALQLALLLEEFAGECAITYADIDTYRSSRGNAGELHHKLPPLPDYPDGIEWKALRRDLMTVVHHFRVERAEAGTAISVDAEFAFDEREHAEVVGLKAIKLGLQAIAIAETLRSRCKLGPAFISEDRTTKAYLLECQERETDREAKRRAVEIPL